MCFFKQPKPKVPQTPNEGEGAAAALRRLEIGRAGAGSSTTNNPTGALGVPGASVVAKTLGVG